MTQDYKNNLLTYLVGRVPTSQKIDIPSFQDVETVQNNLKSYFDGLYANFIPHGFLQSPTNEKMLIYGLFYWKLDYPDYDDEAHGGIVILDKDMNPLQFITKFSSGTPLNPIDVLKYDEDNDIYGIDYTETTGEQGPEYRFRFIMLNDILANDVVKLKRSYYFPSGYNQLLPYATMENPERKIFKAGGSSNYLIFKQESYASGGYFNLTAISLSVNVGVANEWEKYVYNSPGLKSYDVLVTWTSDSYSATIYADYTTTFENITLKGSTFTRGIHPNFPSNIDPYNRQVYILNINDVYIFTRDDNDNALFYKYDNGFNLIETLTGLGTDMNNIVSIDNMLLTIREDNNDDLYLIVMVNDTVTYENITSYVSGSTYVIYASKEYNKINVYIQGDNNCAITYFIYNSTNYNGQPTIEVGSTQPNSMQLEDSSNKILFDRNLYNVEVYNNIIESKMQVPNTYLNSSTISALNLISSYNNTIHIETGLNIEKNQYESLVFNVDNTINMINTDTNETMINGENRLANSSAKTLDYANAQARLLRIIKTSGTSIREIGADEITYNSSTNTYTYQLFFVGASDITNIQILSADGNTIYLDCPVSILEAGKNYYFKQEVTIS